MEEEITPQPEVSHPAKKPKNKNNFLIIILITLLFFAMGIAAYAVYQNSQLKKQIAQLKSQPNQVLPTPNRPSPSLKLKLPLSSKPTTTIKLTENWITYNYNKSNFQPNEGPGYIGYEYQGDITFKYPPSYQFTEATCRTSYLKDKGKFCMNIGGLTLNKDKDFIIVDFLEFYDLKNTDHLQEFNRHEIISEETIEGYKYDVKILKTKLDLTPKEGFESRATIYKVNTSPVGLIFKLKEGLEVSISQLENLEKEILQIIETVEITP